MQPTGRDLYIDRLLSGMSIGYLNALSAYIADLVFPTILVPKQSGKYAKYRKEDMFRDEAKKRSPLTISAGGHFATATPGTFFCDEWAYHQDIPQEDLDNEEDPFNLENDATQNVVEKLRIRRERLFAENYFGESIWANDLNGQTDAPGEGEFIVWDDADSTPIDDVDAAKAIIKESTGLMPNTLVVAEKVHLKLKNHPDILERFKYTQTGILTPELLARVFEVDRYMVASAIYAANKPGVEEDMNYILSKYDALLVYSAPRPAKWQPSGGYTFRWNRPLVGGTEGDRLQSTIRRINLDREGGLRIEGSVYEFMDMISDDCGVFFNDAIADGRTIES